MRVAGKTALITGATSGIGEATAVLFAEEGAAVAVVGRNADRGRAVEETITAAGGRAVFVQTDVRRAEECERAVDETVGAFGRLDVVFNNAGMTKAMPLDHGPQGIRVKAVCPGDADTPMEREDAKHQDMSWDEYVRWAVEGRPIARMASPDEVARAVLFLASEESSFITRAALPVDGGGGVGY